MLTPNERAMLARYCNDHPVAVCRDCSMPLAFDEMGADLFSGGQDSCPRCRADLTAVVREHLAECTMMLVQMREAVGRPRPFCPSDSFSLDELGEAVQESERVRQASEQALGQALRIGRDHLPIQNGCTLSEHVLTTPPDVGILQDDGLDQPPAGRA